MRPSRLDTLQDILSSVEYKDWTFHLGTMGDGHYLQVGFMASDNMRKDSPKEMQKGRKWYLSPHATKSEIVQTAFLAVLTAEEHEVRERFLYRGEAILGPHFDVDAMAFMINRQDRRRAA